MAVCVITSESQSYTYEESDVFESKIIESNVREKILSSHNDDVSATAASKSIVRPISAPPSGNTAFQFGVPCSPVSISSGDNAHTLSKKARAKSYPIVQPACHFFKKFKDEMASKRSCMNVNTLTKLKSKLQGSLRGQDNEELPFNTLPLEQLSTDYHLPAGISSMVDHIVDVHLQLFGPQINAQSSPVNVQGNASERECSPGRICRICHDGSGTLISPCLCSGTVALIHRNCLERWLTQTNSSSCEICRFPFRVERRPLPFYKVFSDSTNTKLRRSILIDLACFVGLTPLALSAICLCLLGAMQNLTTDVDGTIDPVTAKVEEESRRWESGCLIFLALMLLLSYIVWLSCTLNTRMKTWAEWRQASLQVKLLETKRPSQDQIEASANILLAPLRLMIDDATVTPTNESNMQNLHIADSPTSVHLRDAPAPCVAAYDGPARNLPGRISAPDNGDPSDDPAQDVPNISSFPGNGTGRTLSDTVVEAGAVTNCTAVDPSMLNAHHFVE